MTLRRGRGRAPAQRDPLRQGRRQALRPDLGLDQVHARLRSRRLAALPGGDARGRRGSALHRPPNGGAGERGRGTPTRGRWRWPWNAAHAVEHVGMPECALNLAQAAVYLSLAPKSNASIQGARARPRVGARARRARAAGGADERRLPGREEAGRGQGYDYPHDRPRGRLEMELMPTRRRRAFLELPSTARSGSMRERFERIREGARTQDLSARATGQGES